MLGTGSFLGFEDEGLSPAEALGFEQTQASGDEEANEKQDQRASHMAVLYGEFRHSALIPAGPNVGSMHCPETKETALCNSVFGGILNGWNLTQYSNYGGRAIRTV